MDSDSQRYDGASARMILEDLEENIRRQTVSGLVAEQLERNPYSIIRNLAPLHRDQEREWKNRAARARGFLIAALCRIRDET